MDKVILNRYSHIGEDKEDPYYEALWDKSEASVIRYKQILSIIKSNINNPRLSNLEKFNNTIHSYLITLLISSFIGDQSRTSVSAHFNNLINYASDFNIRLLHPSNFYIRSLTEDRLCTWGGPFGTLSYFLHLEEIKKEYLTPSQIAFLSVQSCIKFNNLIPNFPTNELYNNDDLIYAYPLDVIRTEDMRKALLLIEGLSTLLPDILNWYLGPFIERGIAAPPLCPPLNSNEYQAYYTISQIAKVLISRGLDGNNGLSFYDLIHQSLAPTWSSAIEDIVTIRENTLYDINFNNFNRYEELCRRLITLIKRGNLSGVIRRVNYNLLNNFFPPGGYNLALLITSITLVNRAYILTYPSYEPNNKDISRSIQCLYRAGVCLRKSNLNHLMFIGNNLTELSGVTDNLPIDLKDLMYE